LSKDIILLLNYPFFFTKLSLITIGVFPIKVEYITLKIVYTPLIRGHNCKSLH